VELSEGWDRRDNIAVGNDVGIWFSNLDASSNPVTTPTKDSAKGDTARNNAVNNTTGNGPTQGYQVGIADQGARDSIIDNDICGIGYLGPSNSGACIVYERRDRHQQPHRRGHATCSTATPVTTAEASAIPEPGNDAPWTTRPSAIQ
jgi:hypothetical protein